MRFSKTKLNFSYVLGNSIGTTALNASFYLIFAYFMTPDEYGFLNYIIAIAGTASIISQFGFPHSVTVFRSKNKHDLSNQINVFVIILSTIVAIILIPINIYASLLSFSISFFIMNQHNLLGLKKYKEFFWLGIFKGISIISLPILLFFIFDIPGVLLGMSLSNLIFSFYFVKNLNFKIKSWKELKSNLGFITHNFSIQASAGFTKFLDKLLIVPLLGFTYAGLYQFNLQILLALTILPAALHAFLLTEESGGTTHTKITYFTIIAAIFLVLISIPLSPLLVDYFFPKYTDGIPSLQVMIITLIPLSITAALSAKLQAVESKKVGYPAIARVVALLGFVVLLGNFYGLMGLALAVLISSTIETILLTIIYRNQKI